MKRISLPLVLLLWIATFRAQNPNNYDTAWVSSFGGSSFDEGRDLKETSDGGLIIAGTTSSFGDGNTSFYLIKTDTFGHYQWSRAFGTANNDIARSIELAGDGGYFVSGYSNGIPQNGYDGYLVKTDNMGNVQWSKNYGGDDWDFFYNACIMPDGGLILCGETYSGTNGGSDAYLVRTNALGDTLWTRKIGVPGNDDAFYSVEQKNNLIYVVGKQFNPPSNKSGASIYEIDFNGGVHSFNVYAPDTVQNFIYNDLFLSHNGDVILGGRRIRNNSDTSKHYILRRVDATTYAESYSTGNNAPFDIQCVLEGYYDDVYTLSQSIGGYGGYSALYFRFSPQLYAIYNRDFGGSGDEDAFEIIRTHLGYAFVGSTTSFGNSNQSVDKNVYLVVTDKVAMVHDYYEPVIEYYDGLSPVGIKVNSAGALKTNIYPNPVSTTATIGLGSSFLNGESLRYQLFDMQGRLIDEEQLTVKDDRIIIDRKTIKAGAYTYQLKHEGKVLSVGKLFMD